MTPNASVKGNFVYVFNEELKNTLVRNGLKPLYSKKLNNIDVWVFVRDENVLGHLVFNRDNDEKYVLSDKMMF